MTEIKWEMEISEDKSWIVENNVGASCLIVDPLPVSNERGEREGREGEKKNIDVNISRFIVYYALHACHISKSNC